MDKFMPALMSRRPAADDRQGGTRPPGRRRHQASRRRPSPIAVGGAAYLVSQAVRAARVVAFADLGMEAIYEFQVRLYP